MSAGDIMRAPTYPIRVSERIERNDKVAESNLSSNSTETRQRKFLRHGQANEEDQSTDHDHSIFTKQTSLRMTRKRAANLAGLDEEKVSDNKDIIVEQKVPISTDQGTHSSPTDVCLCQPDPKIPRPRNAFILYRQHHHQNILAQNPGLSNPEISKLAGQLWAKESEIVKEDWKNLALEEKNRHALQYPDYRFQPRHKPKIQSPPVCVRCDKCGGRIIIGASPTFFRTNPNKLVVSLGSVPNSANSLISSAQTLPQLKNLQLYSPQGVTVLEKSPKTSASSPLEDQADMMETKRRRFNPYPPGHPREQRTRPLSSDGSRTRTFSSSSMTPIRRESLPSLTSPRSLPSQDQSHPSIQTSAVSSMVMGPPPPRNSIPQSGLHAHPATPLPRDIEINREQESMVLPPLRSAVVQGRSIESLIMGMPYLAKIKILQRVAPPPQIPGSIPGSLNRGAFIAVEGDFDAPISGVLRGLKEYLNRTGEFSIKVMTGPQDPAEGAHFGAYMEEVGRWHAKAAEIRNFLTGEEANDAIDYNDETENYHEALGKMDLDSSRGSIDSQSQPEHRKSLDRRTSSVSSATQGSNGKHSEASSLISPSSSFDSSSRKIPLLIIPRYLVHSSNAWAAALPIDDSYSPTDHWQWVATLWRGVPGADFTVYVRSEANADNPTPTSDSWISKSQVDIRERLGTVTIRYEKGRLDDASIRRVAFEVGEWARFGLLNK